MTQSAPGSTATSPTVWDRSREQAHREILETALRLFVEQGYDETPIAQIALEAGVSQRTLFRYFGSKEDLLGGDQQQFGQVLTDAVSKQPSEADAWAALRAGFAAVLALHDPGDHALKRFRLLHKTATLRAGWLEKRLRFSGDLLPLINARMDVTGGGGDAKARAVIAAAFACLDTASRIWVDNNGRGEMIDLYDECVATVRSSAQASWPEHDGGGERDG